MKLSINIKHIEAVRLYYREESKEFWLEISTTSNKPIIVPYKELTRTPCALGSLEQGGIVTNNLTNLEMSN